MSGPSCWRFRRPGDDGSLNGNIVDIWQVPLEDAGPPAPTRVKAASICCCRRVTPIPSRGYIVLRPATFGGYALLRSNLKSHSDADVAKSVAYGKKVKVYPLSQAANPPPPCSPMRRTCVFDSTIRYDAQLLRLARPLVQSEPWLARDRAMIDLLRTLGIEKGKPFNPDAKTKAALDTGVREAQAWLERDTTRVSRPSIQDSRWMFPALSGDDRGGASRFQRPEQIPGRCARPDLHLCVHRH